MPRYRLLAAAFALVLPGLPASAQTDFAGRERIEWCDLWITHANETKLPRVLLLGDSITRGYDPEVEKRLAGVAYVSRLTSSAFISDPMLLAETLLVLDNVRFDVIQINNGMHGWHHSEAEYESALPTFIAALRAHARGAKLIWASTTGLKPLGPAPADDTTAPKNAAAADKGKLMMSEDMAPASNARIDRRNAIAAAYMRSQGIPIDDLHAIVQGHPEYYSGAVHFNATGIAAQADHVAAALRPLLP